tara:strand:+ start:717 stop:1526 length:810 start_codon:yes stop_codon:yes gene_type:complete
MTWIKIESHTPDKPEIMALAELLDMDEDAVLGKLVRVWIWADYQTANGYAPSATKRGLDRVAGHAGFADALLDCHVGWVTEDGQRGLVFSNFERHNGKCAKKRAMDSRRKAEQRALVQEKSHSEADNTVTREEKRREEKIREDEIKLDENRSVQNDTEPKKPKTPSKPKKKTAPKYGEDFETWWSAWPRKEGKGTAWASWQSADLPAFDVLALSVKSWTPIWKSRSADPKDPWKYTPLASSWLNGRKWEDEAPLHSVSTFKRNPIGPAL